ncbi:uncharacterized protein RJT20DRAFT_123651 [Scheffersomyces xylosifermentans]|uniref:uncharacterized protein n=1 Tax=Scheffersomyces xylosifermentans TaxID=1304137 RepID=UPI00315CC405
MVRAKYSVLNEGGKKRSESIPLETFDTGEELADERSNMSEPASSQEDLDEVFQDDFEQESDNESMGFMNREGFYSQGYRERIVRFFYLVWNGPDEPEDPPAPRIEFLKGLEELPERFNRSLAKEYRVSMLIFYLLFWFGLCYTILIPYLTIPSTLSSDPEVRVISLSCQGNSEFWRGKNGECGLDGMLCPGSKLEEEVVFRCPALCDRSSWTYSLIPIGDQRIKYRGYFVGGGDKVQNVIDKDQISNPYRADSYPCGAGVHAGVISPFFGGCARVSYKSKEQNSFNSTKGHYGVSDSIEFLSFFKSSYFFKKLASGVTDDGSFTHCYDPRLLILVVNIILGIPVVYLGSGAVAYWTISIVGFWTICMATDPPVTVDATDPEDFANLISIGLERFLPTCCILYVLWHCSAKRTLSEPPLESGAKASPLSRLIYWYPLFWLGVLNNMTFDRLPVDRLTLHDLKEQSGALLAVGSIISTILICAFIQAYKIWLSGRFRKYLTIYGGFIIGLVLVSHLPGLTLRIHHYILAMLLIPGCATRGRTALLFQGILSGLFLSGVSRWGLAAIAETVTSLKRDDPQGKVFPPEISSYDVGTGSLSWKGLSEEFLSPIQYKMYEKYSSISVLVNDIERYVGDKVESVNLKEIFANSTELASQIAESLKSGYKDKDGNIAIYVRVGRKIPGTNVYSDFTNAAVLRWPNGNMSFPKPGLT